MESLLNRKYKKSKAQPAQSAGTQTQSSEKQVSAGINQHRLAEYLPRLTYTVDVKEADSQV
jgi:hypothetical protein